MKIGTRSVLYGAHCFLLHPWFVALGWWKLYGFPWDPRLWVAFFVHDIGYLGRPNMDGPEGEQHPKVGGQIMFRWFDRVGFWQMVCDGFWGHKGSWFDFVVNHSRFLARQRGQKPSRLCFADKMCICITPWWVYRITAGLTGEIREYRKTAERRMSKGWAEKEALAHTDRQWYEHVQSYMRDWITEHIDGREDTWTPSTGREPRDDSGVWQ